MMHYQDIYKRKDYKIDFLKMHEINRLNGSFQKKWTMKTYKAFQVDNGDIRIRRPVTHITNEWGHIDFGHTYYSNYMRGWCDEFGCKPIVNPDNIIFTEWIFEPDKGEIKNGSSL